MKNTISIIAALTISIFIFTNCDNNSKKQPNKNPTDNIIVKSKLDEAKEIAKTILDYVEQADSKQITKEELDKKAMPLQKQLDSLRLILTTNEIKELDSYRTQLFNELIDRKVIRDRK